MSTTARSTQDPTTGFFWNVRKLWVKKTGIDWETYKSIFKGALAPAIALACFQATSWANLFSTFGYLVPVAVIILYPMAPRAQFMQTMVMNIITVCFAAGVTALALFCVVKARQHTTPAGATSSTYNSSASAVAAIWLIVQTFVISAIRANYVLMAWPCSAWLVFSNFGMIYGTEAADMPAAMLILRRLLYAHLVGFAISIGVSLVIFPTTNRKAFYRAVEHCVETMTSALDANLALMEILSKEDEVNERDAKTSVNDTTRELIASLSSLTNALPLAKQEIAFSKLKPEQLEAIHYHMEAIVIPLISLGQLPVIMEQNDGTQDSSDNFSASSRKVPARLLASIIGPYSQSVRRMSGGIEHALQTFRLPRSTRHDRKARDDGFSSNVDLIPALKQSLEDVRDSKESLSNAWSGLQNNEDGDENAEKPKYQTEEGQKPIKTVCETDRKHLYVILYTEFIFWSLSRRVLNLVIFAEEMKASGVLNGPKLVLGEYTQLKKFLSRDAERMERSDYIVQATAGRRDPSHLPPTTYWQRSSNLLRVVPRFFASPAAAFGLRVVCATMSIAIVGFLKDTQAFYIKQHLLWAQYMLSFAFQTSAGQGFRHFVFRLTGTIVAVLSAWISWYVVVGHRAGVLVFYFIFIHIPIYIMVKHPPLASVGSVCAFALTIVLGDKLQIQKIGLAASRALNLAILPMYLVGAIRLAAISGGLLLASIWTVFPYPISEHEQLRQDMGRCMETLANYHAMTCEALHIRIRGKDGDFDSATRVSREKARSRLFTKCTTQLQGMRLQLRFIKWEIPIGGRFPRELYEQAIAKIDSLLRNTQLLLFASASFVEFLATEDEKVKASQWLPRFQSLMDGVKLREDGITTLLILLSNSIANGSPLPPHVRVPPCHVLSRQLDDMDKELLDTRHIAEPGHATFAIIEIGIQRIHDDLEGLLGTAKELVGEMDFSCSNFEAAPLLEHR